MNHAIPSTVIWAYSAFALILAIGLIAIFLRGRWQSMRGLDKLILFGPLFYAAPIAAFGTEHFTLAKPIASMVPTWIPWHLFWVYIVGACFIAAGLSLVTGIQARLAASLLALTFFLFFVLMDLPPLAQNWAQNWAENPPSRIEVALILRELSFSAGALALAVSLGLQAGKRSAQMLATAARYVIAITVLFYSVEQFLHADHVPGVPLERVTPPWIHGHVLWTYLCAAAYAALGALLLTGKKTRSAALWLGATVLFVELVVYLPIAIADRASLDLGFNYMADTLMFCGAVLLLAMPDAGHSIQAQPQSRMGGKQMSLST